MPPNRHHGARHNPRRAKHRRRRNRYQPPLVPPRPEGIYLPFDDTWRAYYNDTSGLRCGGFATAEMLSVHHNRTFDPEPIYQRALVLQPPGPATSPWANLKAAQEFGYIRDFKWFNTLDVARSTLAEGLAFIALTPNFGGGAHIWCCTGISDFTQSLYTPNDVGAPQDSAFPFDWFESVMRANSWACCGVGLF